MMPNIQNNFLGNHNKFDKAVLIWKLKCIRRKAHEAGIDDKVMKTFLENELLTSSTKPKKTRLNCSNILSFLFLFTIILIAVFLNNYDIKRSRCTVENNYLVMEITRPVTDCSICKGVDNFRIMRNVTKSEFSKFAYSGQPMLVKGGCLYWKALKTFNFNFFKRLYLETNGAFQSVEEECQFFPFKTEFLSLQDVFNMSESRATMSLSEEATWYIGWSNCNPVISAVLREHYSRPYFLPDDSELSTIDWIFMGYAGQGASMHLDYVQRPSWQAQIAGRKTWYLQPPPECENVCHSMNVTVHKGDIILIDTNQWYHTTFIEGNDMSITVGSEYD